MARHDDPPTSIAHYKITAKLGEGGVGAVCRAKDMRPGHDVVVTPTVRMEAKRRALDEIAARQNAAD